MACSTKEKRMNKIALGLVVSSGCSLFACEPTFHSLAPKISYKHHIEEGYTYDVVGMTLEFRHETPLGIGYIHKGFTNFSGEEPLAMGETEMYYRIPLSDKGQLFPRIGSTFSSHVIQNDEDYKYTVNKMISTFGSSYEHEIFKNTRVGIGLQYFKDISNTMTIQKNHEFYGKSYENPAGFLVTALGNFKWEKGIGVELAGSMAKTFKKEFTDYGIDLTLKWDF